MRTQSPILALRLRETIAKAMIKDQVNSMFYGTSNVSTRTLFKMIAVLLLSLSGAGAAVAANTGATPQLVPGLAGLVAGNAQLAVSSSVAGFGGDGSRGSAATLSGPNVLAVDAVGNVYFPDAGNGVIREINAQTGVISTVVGAIPTNCTGTGACHTNIGCADGVPAVGNANGSQIAGIAVDAYDNVFFSEAVTNTISVVYRGGAQVAAFIALENPSGVAKSGGVQPGFVYHVAGSINLASCTGSASKAASATVTAVPAGDGQLAYNGGGLAVTVTFGGLGPLGLDSAGNLYIGDAGVNQVIRVVNTHSAAQTFFSGPGSAGTTVQPGFIQSVVDCGTLTTLCPAGAGNSPQTLANTGIGGPAAGGVYNHLGSGNGGYMSVDAYGNVFELGSSTSTPCQCLAVAYAGGTALGRLISQADSAETGIAGAVTLPPATSGDFYFVLNNITLRPSSAATDPTGNIYYQDNHYGQVYRVDANATAVGASLLGYSSIFYGGSTDVNRSVPATPAAPAFCYGAGSGLAQSTSNLTLTGYQTTDPYGDGCPANLANGVGVPHSGSGYGTTIADGLGNLLIADRTSNLIRKVTLANNFPATAVGQQLNATTLAGQQTLQVHFDQTNLPVGPNTPSPVTTGAFSIAAGIPDFTLNPIQSTRTTQSAPTPVGGLPTCANQTAAADSSLDCFVNVIFSPTLPGLRQSQLVVTTFNGSTYTLGLTGIGNGGQLAIDGGAPATVPVSGLGNAAQVAVSQTGTVYVADPANNRIVVNPGSGTFTGGTTAGSAAVNTTVTPGLAVGEAISGPGIPAGTTIASYVTGTVTLSANATATATVTLTVGGGALTTVGTGLSHPMGVAVDASGNIYIADTGNNRVLEVSQATGAQTVLGNIVATGNPAYTQYAFKGPQSLAVDLSGNVYVADTGNAAVVEIPSNPVLGGATPLLQYPGAPTFKSPVAVALDVKGNLYIADTGQIQILEIPAGGGDLQTLPVAGRNLSGAGLAVQPSSVVVDAAGDVYLSGYEPVSGTYQVSLAGTASGPSGTQFTLPLTGLNFTGSAGSTSFQGGSLALDANGNLYVADSGNSRVLFVNRQNPTVAFGVVAQGATVPQQTLFVTNIGNLPTTIPSSFGSITATSPAGITAFTVPTNTCTGTLLPGAHCQLTTNFAPKTNGAQSASVSVNGTTQTITLAGTGEAPMVKIVLTENGTTVGQPGVVTATVTQPNLPGVTPTGTVTFSYLIQGDGTKGTTTATLSGTGGTSTATLTFPALLQGRKYFINATYNADTLDSATVAPQFIFYIPGVPVTVTANSVTYVYGQAVPAITGTVVGILDPAVSYKFVTAATPSSPIGTYPINVVFTGGSYLNYGFPPTLTPGGAPAVVVETAAALTVKANNATSLYGAPALNYVSTVTGLVNGDQVIETYTPVDSSILNVGTYTLVPTIGSPVAGNYIPTVTNGQLIVTSAPSVVSLAPAAPSVLYNALSTDPILISTGTAVVQGKGTPTGTVTLTDTFTPIISGPPGTSATLAPVTIGPLSLIAGVATYIPTSGAFGTHVYTATYSGDSNFQPSTTASSSSVIVDVADFNVSLPSSPIVIAPGIVPGGAGITGGSASAVEQATITITSVLSYNGTVFLGCVPQSPSYTTCTIVAPAVTVPKPATGATSATIQAVLSVQAPATLPLGFDFTVAEVKHPISGTVLAFLPLGVLVFCVRRKRRLTNLLWMFSALAVLCTGLNGCGGGNLVHFFTPVPAGSQTIAVYACTVQSSCPNISITGAITSGNASVTAVSSTTGLAVGGSLVGPSTGFSGDTTSGNATVKNIPSTIGLSSGVSVSGAGVPLGATITAVTAPTATAGGTVTLSVPATATTGSVAFTAGSPILPGTTIASIGSGTITLSAPATGTGTVGLTAATTSTGLTRSFTATTSFQ